MEITKINSISFTRMSNALHIQFHHGVTELISKFGAISLMLNLKLNTQYTEQVGVEQTMVNRSLSNPYSADIQATDMRRDNLFRYIVSDLARLKYSAVDSERELYAKLEKPILKRYPVGIVNSGSLEETSQIRGFIYDLRTDFEDEISARNLDTTLAMLDLANNKFETLYLARIESYSESEKGQMAATRINCDNLYMLLVQSVVTNANCTVDASDEDAETKQAKYDSCAKFVAQLNVLIEKFKRRLDQITNGLAGDGTGDDGADENKDSASGVMAGVTSGVASGTVKSGVASGGTSGVASTIPADSSASATDDKVVKVPNTTTNTGVVTSVDTAAIV